MGWNKSKIFLIVCVGFVLGVTIARFVGYEFVAIITMVAIVALTVFWNNPTILIVCLAILALAGGALRYKAYQQTNFLIPFYGQKIELDGVVAEEPDVRGDKTLLTISDLVINGEKLSGKVLITTARFPEYKYGDSIKVAGKVQEPKDAEQKGEFSYKNYLSRFGITALVYYPDISLIGSGGGNLIKRVLLEFKTHFVSTLSTLLPEPQNAFLSGILVGLRRSIPQDLLDSFNITGTTHIIALSGFNITIIADALAKSLERFGRRISFVLSLLAILLFVILSGASASVVRAGIMGSLILIALNIGRLYTITNALVFTGSVMLFLNPKILHFDVGFQLSFLALMGLIYLLPVIEPYFSRVPKPIQKYLLPTIAAQIFTLPILLYNFDRLSLVSVLTNLLVLPVIPLAMFTGFFSGLLAIILPLLAQPLVWVTWLLLAFVIKVVELTASIPLASVSVESFPLELVYVYYFGLSAIIICFYYPSIKDKIFELWKKQLKN